MAKEISPSFASENRICQIKTLNVFSFFHLYVTLSDKKMSDNIDKIFFEVKKILSDEK